MSQLQTNITNLQDLLEQINALPEAGGVELPELQNEGSREDLMLNKELIDADGNKITGTFSIDTELSTQDSLITQIQTALQDKASASGEDVTSETNAYTTKLATLETAITALETELQGKASGGGSLDLCTLSITRDENYSILAVSVENGIPVPHYTEDSTSDYTIETFCGSVVAISSNYPIAFNLINAVEISDTFAYVKDGFLGNKFRIYVFRITANAGETASIDIYEA